MVTDWYQCVANFAAENASTLGVPSPWLVKGVRSLVFRIYQDHSTAEFDIVCEYGTKQTAVHCLVNLFDIRDFIKKKEENVHRD